MATPTDPPEGTPASGAAGRQPERPKRPGDTGGDSGASPPGQPSSPDTPEAPDAPDSPDDTGESGATDKSSATTERRGLLRQPTRRMPAHDQPDRTPPPPPVPPPSEMRGGRPDPRLDALRHMPRRDPSRPYWGPPIVPGVGWQGEAPGGLPSEPGVGRIRQIVLTVLIVLVTISLIVFLIIYWNRDTDGPRSSGQDPANATQPESSADESASDSASGDPSGSDAADLPVEEITTSANEFYSQARAGQFSVILDQSCADLAGDGTNGVDALSEQYDDLLSWTVDGVEPGESGDGQVAIVSATLRIAEPDAPNGPSGPGLGGPGLPGPGNPSLPGPGNPANPGGQAGTETEDSLLFIDEDGWRYCGAS